MNKDDAPNNGECPECGSALRWNKYGARWDCSNYGACENAGG